MHGAQRSSGAPPTLSAQHPVRSLQAEEFLRLLGQDRTKVISQVRELPASFSQSERVPVKCETIDF